MGDESYSESYTYNADGTLHQIAGSNGRTVTMGYDELRRLSGKTVKQGDTTVVSYTYSYCDISETATTTQIASVQVTAANSATTYAYTYDSSGNILSVRDGTNTTSYVYDSMNQLLRENNQAANKTWVWTYDNAGNIQIKSEYAYTTGELGEAVDTVSYGYTDENWSDLLTSYDGNTITYDEIGNPLSDGTWTYTWENGRQLASMTDGENTWTYTYNAGGLRTSRSNGTTTYEYTYNGDTLVQMVVNTNSESETDSRDALYFTSDSVTFNETLYYYIKNLHGDVTYIVDSSGTIVVSYTYDAWGNVLSTSGTLASTLGVLNPLRYRGYVYDPETQLYYLQSRYYDPEIGRFIHADSYTSTGQGILSNNMFAYCGNCPVVYTDPSGEAFVGAGVQLDISTGNYECGIEVIVYWDEDVCQGEGLVVAVYVYEGMSVNLDELYKNPDVINTIKQLTLALASNAGVDYETLSLVELQAVLFGLNVSGSLVFIWGYEGKFDSTDDYAGPFTSYSGNVKHVKATFSYCDTCWSVAIGGTTERKPHLSYGQTNYTQIYSSFD